MFEEVKKNLETLGYKVSCFDTGKDVSEYLNKEIDNTTVGIGGSVTLNQLEIYPVLKSHNEVYWHWKAEPGEDKNEIIKNAGKAKVYISSVNALAKTGEIINIDGNCNRISAILYGHERVYLVAGENKITDDYDSALYRARNIAAPLNAIRVGADTPCSKKGDKCYDCKSPDRICRGLSVLWAKPSLCEFEIVLVKESLGY